MTTETTKPFDAKSLRADFPILGQQIHGKKPLVYLDNGASTQRPQQVINAIVNCYSNTYANVHRGNHTLAMRSDKLYEEARTRVARFIGSPRNHQVIFTSGTTVAINVVARSWGDTNVAAGDEILVTMMEHHSNIVPWQQLAQRTGATVRFIPLTEDGRLELDELDSLLSERTKVVAFTAVSNVLGTMNPVEEIARKAHQVGAMVVVDAAQHVPHETTDVTKWDADFIAFSGHKMLAPSGIGILWGKEELLESMPPFLGGGSMIQSVTLDGFTPGELPAKFEAGTPPIVPAIGLGAAIEYLEQVGLNEIATHERELTRRAHDVFSKIDGMRILGPNPDHKAGIVSFDIEGVNSNDLAVFLDLEGVAVRNGHHCAMPLHASLGLASSTRASFYLYNTFDEIDYTGEALKRVIAKLR